MQENAKAAETARARGCQIYIQTRAFETSQSSQYYQNCEKDRRTAIAKKNTMQKIFFNTDKK